MIINWGEYKGKSLFKVLKEDPQFVIDLERNSKNFLWRKNARHLLNNLFNTGGSPQIVQDWWYNRNDTDGDSNYRAPDIDMSWMFDDDEDLV